MGSPDKEKKPATVTDMTKKAPALTSEADHSPNAARAASNLDLGKLAHQNASRATFDSVQSGLSLLAKEMHRAPAELAEAKTTIDVEHNDSNGIDKVLLIAHKISSEAANLKSLYAKSDLPATMGPEVKKLSGAWSMCKGSLEKALIWTGSSEANASKSVDFIDADVNAIISTLGTDAKHLAADLHEPQGEMNAMDDAAFAADLKAARTALESYVAGNEQDGDRLVTLCQHIGVKGNYDDVATKHPQRPHQVSALREKVDTAMQRDKAHKKERLAPALGNLASKKK